MGISAKAMRAIPSTICNSVSIAMGGTVPAVDLPLAHFFAILFQHDIYPIDSAAIKILPKNALNCYLPIPFKSLRLEITNNSDRAIPLWFMADWSSYDNAELTPLRLQVTHSGEYPAQSLGSMLMADYSGSGFIAGMVKGRGRKRSR